MKNNPKEIGTVAEILKELFVPEYDFEKNIYMSSLQTVEDEKDYQKLVEDTAKAILTNQKRRKKIK